MVPGTSTAWSRPLCWQGTMCPVTGGWGQKWKQIFHFTNQLMSSIGVKTFFLEGEVGSHLNAVLCDYLLVGYSAAPPGVLYLCHHKEGWTAVCDAALRNSVLQNFFKSLCDNILQYSREQSKPLGSGNLKNPTPRGSSKCSTPVWQINWCLTADYGSKCVLLRHLQLSPSIQGKYPAFCILSCCLLPLRQTFLFCHVIKNLFTTGLLYTVMNPVLQTNESPTKLILALLMADVTTWGAAPSNGGRRGK